MKYFLCLLGIFSSLFCLSQVELIKINEPLDTIAIEVKLGENQTSIVKQILLVSDTILDITISHGNFIDFKTGNQISEMTLDSSEVTVSSSPEQVLLNFANITSGGIYNNQFQFHNDDTLYNSVYIKLTLLPYDAINIINENTPLDISIVKHKGLPFLLPNNLREDQFGLLMENDFHYPIKIKPNGIYLTGENSVGSDTHIQLNGTDTVFEILPGKKKIIPFQFTTAKSKPDAYKGFLSYELSNRDATLDIPVTISVRNGIVGAAIAILVGMLFGRWIKQVDDQKKAIELIQKVNEVELKSLVLSATRRIWFKSEFQNLKQRVVHAQTDEKLKELEAELASITSQIDKTMDLENQEKIARELQLEEKIELLADEAWNLIVTHDLEGATEKINLISSTITTPRSKSAVPADMGKVGKVKDVEYPGFAPPKGWKKLLYNLTISKPTFSALMYFILPVVYLVTALIALLLGIQEMYLKGGATFGSEGFWDYLKLFLYGTTITVLANIAYGSTLQGFLGKFNAE